MVGQLVTVSLTHSGSYSLPVVLSGAQSTRYSNTPLSLVLSSRIALTSQISPSTAVSFFFRRGTVSFLLLFGMPVESRRSSWGTLRMLLEKSEHKRLTGIKTELQGIGLYTSVLPYLQRFCA